MCARDRSQQLRTWTHLCAAVAAFATASPSAGLTAQELPWVLISKYRIGAEAELGRFSDVKLAADGGLLVLDAGDSLVRVFDPEGMPAGSLGGAGEGPGELSAPMRIAPAPDGGVYVLERRGLVHLHRDGSPADRWPLGQAALGLVQRMEYSGQGVLIQRNALRRPGSPPLPVELLSYSPGEPLPTQLWTFDGTETTSGATRVILAPLPLWHPVADGLIAVGKSDKYELAILTGDGNVIATIGRDIEPLEIPESFKRTVRAQIAATRPVGGDFPPIEFAPTFPVISGVIGGPDGSIIVVRGAGLGGEFAGTAAERPHWDVFSAEGDYMGYLAAPNSFQVLGGADGVVVGLVPDEVDELERAIEVLQVIAEDQP